MASVPSRESDRLGANTATLTRPCYNPRMTHDQPPPEAWEDCFHPPSLSTLVHCIHCNEEYDSWRIEWRVYTHEDGSTHGFWCCPIKECDGKGFGFDIFPVDPTYVDPDGRDMGWSNSDEDEEGEEDEESDDEEEDDVDWDEEDDEEEEEREEEENAGGLAVEDRPGGGGTFMDEIGYLRDEVEEEEDADAAGKPQRPMTRPVKGLPPIDEDEIPY